MPYKHPTSEDIKAARVYAKLTQAQAAALVYKANYKTWQTWELGTKQMAIDTWHLFLLRTNNQSMLVEYGL